MAKPLYLHIGQTKTGTTTLQAFLHANRAAIRRLGIHYPAVPAPEPLKIQHRFLADSLHESGDDPTRAGKVWSPYLRQVLDDDAPTAVMSEETFWHLFEQRPDRRQRALAWMAEALNDFDVHIVCYLRRQDLWLESWFHQTAKAPVHRPMAELSFDEFVERQQQIGLLDYEAAIGDWADAFGADALIVRAHDHATLLNGDIVDDFCALIGLNVDATMARPRPVQRRLDPAACALSNLFGRTPGASPHRTSFLQAVIGSEAPASAATRLMSTSRAQEVVARYAPGNAALARRHGGLPTLFTPVETESVEVYGGIDAQGLARLVIRLYVAQQRQIERLRGGNDPAPNERPRLRSAATPPVIDAGLPCAARQPGAHHIMATPSDRPRLILHIGTHKTGTSALQEAFESQRAQLLQAGILYPSTSRPPFAEFPKHSSVFTAAVSSDPGAADRERAALLNEFESSGARALLLSEEGLSEPDERVVRFFDPLVGRFDIHVVCYLRRQDAFVESLFNQYVREIPRRDPRPLSEFIAAPGVCARMDYHALLSRWASLPATIHAREFGAAARGGLAASFASILGVSALVLPERRSNPTPDMRLALLFNELNRRGIAYDPQPLMCAAAALTEAGLARQEHVLGADERRRLLARYSDCNRQLAADFDIRFESALPAGEPPRMAEGVDLPFVLQLVGALASQSLAPEDTATGV